MPHASSYQNRCSDCGMAHYHRPSDCMVIRVLAVVIYPVARATPGWRDVLDVGNQSRQ
jgi:hypothetical protein